MQILRGFSKENLLKSGVTIEVKKHHKGSFFNISLSPSSPSPRFSCESYSFRLGISCPVIIGNSTRNRISSIPAISMPGILLSACLAIAKIPKP